MALAATALLCGCAAKAEAPDPAATRDLPLTLVPASGRSGAFVVLLTGDGGWVRFDRRLADALAKAGAPVVGWNSRAYFGTQRTPDAAAADLQRVITAYGRALDRNRVLLVGFSFGADALPFMISRLPPSDRAKIQGVALIAPSAKAQFHFSPLDWLFPRREGPQTAPAIAALSPLPTLCAYGDRDAASICPRLATGAAQILARPGGHHLQGGDDPALVEAILRLESAGPGSARPTAAAPARP